MAELRGGVKSTPCPTGRAPGELSDEMKGLVKGPTKVTGIYADPACNTLRFQAGCILDSLEKACESVKALTTCAPAPKTCKEKSAEFPETPLIFTEEFSDEQKDADGGRIEALICFLLLMGHLLIKLAGGLRVALSCA